MFGRLYRELIQTEIMERIRKIFVIGWKEVIHLYV